ncbi:DUF3108 domain-containing protein [Paucibacter sp. KCTC 42545]|uniref:DUF3108 domain-containing protein n=1 Tax=Paucibacter sp. KCTC 42545 TaxID=1768242 RepID=UPI000733C538|nr:DUF3108 domain-containing protein [Paucibacter sp. KCTC 42545]ALT79298.1 hypothetical protein AT984_20960 [Paucibacter sp. KCTC 42545]
MFARSAFLSALPRRSTRQALAAAVLLSLLAHLALLLPAKRAAAPASAVPSAKALITLQTRAVPPQPAVKRSDGTSTSGFAAKTAAILPSSTQRPPAEPEPGSAKSKPSIAAAPAELADSTALAAAAPARPGSAPPSGEWHYLLRSGEREGQAKLVWHSEAGRYALRLERQLEGRALPSWHSQGTLDGLGLAPQRFTQQRRGRERAAINFRADEGLLSFSASEALLPLEPGTQDRLSWWLQLSALVEADPAFYTAGRSFSLRVAALRGTALDWQFEVLGLVPLAQDDGSSVQALQLRRAPLGPHSGEVQLWLDPARHHLPLRLNFELPDERGWSLRLQPEASSGPASSAAGT